MLSGNGLSFLISYRDDPLIVNKEYVQEHFDSWLLETLRTVRHYRNRFGDIHLVSILYILTDMDSDNSGF